MLANAYFISDRAQASLFVLSYDDIVPNWTYPGGVGGDRAARARRHRGIGAVLTEAAVVVRAHTADPTGGCYLPGVLVADTLNNLRRPGPAPPIS